jgi:hypothetical protein
MNEEKFFTKKISDFLFVRIGEEWKKNKRKNGKMWMEREENRVLKLGRERENISINIYTCKSQIIIIINFSRAAMLNREKKNPGKTSTRCRQPASSSRVRKIYFFQWFFYFQAKLIRKSSFSCYIFCDYECKNNNIQI